ncbi:M23 family metallopeptidase [candidate division WOR-3 bacterium]|nr:M23 family metallopeptidase [candidate division WOR-3 bacterium]
MIIQRVTGYLKERVAFLVESGTGSRIVKLSVPRWIIASLALAFLILLAGVFSFIAEGGLGYNNRRHLESKNQRLMGKYHVLKKRADSLERALALLETHDIELRVLKDMEVLPSDVRKLGVGGTAAEPEELIELKKLETPNYQDIAEIRQGIDGLMRRAKHQNESFAEIDAVLLRNAEIYDHIPSIVPTTGTYCGKFGYRTDPILGIRKMHCGVDISNLSGTPIIATADGVVSYAGWINGYGHTVKIEHGNCLQTVYAHLSQIYVAVGQEVSRYEIIAAMGNSGRTVGTHLHYEVRVAGKAVNPEGYFLNGEEALNQYPMP